MLQPKITDPWSLIDGSSDDFKVSEEQETNLDKQPDAKDEIVCKEADKKSNPTVPFEDTAMQAPPSQPPTESPLATHSIKASYSSQNNFLFYAPIAIAVAAGVGVGFALTRRFNK